MTSNITNFTKIHQQIQQLQTALDKKITILGHHYQDQEIIEHCDYTGDSLELSRHAANVHSENIVFCGVYFMAESAALLAQESQRVYLPEPSASCMMSLMSPALLIETIIKKLSKNNRKIIPIAYINTTLAVKAVVGKYNGAVCTSSNAEQVLKWALQEGDGVLFLPDKNLAYNTANRIGIAKKDTHLLDIRKNGEFVNLEACKNASLLIWPGLCAIHTRFMIPHILAAREEHPNCRIVVHPECTPDVVKNADASGSTAFIINYTKNVPEGSHLYIGTEINLVQRLQRTHAKRITIKPLRSSACSHMAKNTPSKLHKTLSDIYTNTATHITIEKTTACFAKASLETMFDICD